LRPLFALPPPPPRPTLFPYTTLFRSHQLVAELVLEHREVAVETVALELREVRRLLHRRRILPLERAKPAFVAADGLASCRLRGEPADPIIVRKAPEACPQKGIVDGWRQTARLPSARTEKWPSGSPRRNPSFPREPPP